MKLGSSEKQSGTLLKNTTGNKYNVAIKNCSSFHVLTISLVVHVNYNSPFLLESFIMDFPIK